MMEAFGILGFVFGLVAFVRMEKLTKTLKEKGILEEDYKEE
ncbi:hypothetical protein N9Y04_02480 [Porticoccaceae bacterium]|jgi:hypothetical protein|nr:hypothetical protein [Porticoccaceae bacterium]MDC0052630.1 hypothetical protein [Gammaproteobacteria bacterium]MDB2620785.1 hypothetical protein [Porticoccaceae bacterium]MDB2669554.1 hypothetical protein [Porticoccaceae bacterium]MDG1323922.1 hypothetical protein [Porticoccaceae bacterium]|tara:strand:+ start:22 stop:144 length:123 start_codon:yes stop_codon:yes gene_type:complete